LNERIKLLAEQAEFSENDLHIQGDNFQYFAELIVRECIDIADEYDGVGSTIVGRIQKHFGVK